MKALEKRVEKLEQQIPPKEAEFVTFRVIYGKEASPDCEIKEVLSDIQWRPK